METNVCIKSKTLDHRIIRVLLLAAHGNVREAVHKSTLAGFLNENEAAVVEVFNTLAGYNDVVQSGRDGTWCLGYADNLTRGPDNVSIHQ
jgi:hypothetical protein